MNQPVTLGDSKASPAPPVQELRLDPRLDPAAYAAIYAKYGRLHVPGLLERTSAAFLYAAINAPDVPWQMHYNDGSAASYDVPASQIDALTAAERETFMRPINARARLGFQYAFDNFSLYDHYEAGQHRELAVMRAYEFLKSPATLEFARRVTGRPDIGSVDAQATRYRAGHFLTAHDDRDEDKGRVAAYVLNLTPTWRPDWGGILQFLDADGHVAEGYAPKFNALNLFRVPALHSVSLVAPFAGGARLSITGWFRRK
jgi:Rps23 Pro-64 3,4-dihydroxylase Tpa1-like proline 4-hydroxylase